MLSKLRGRPRVPGHHGHWASVAGLVLLQVVVWVWPGRGRKPRISLELPPRALLWCEDPGNRPALRQMSPSKRH